MLQLQLLLQTNVHEDARLYWPHVKKRTEEKRPNSRANLKKHAKTQKRRVSRRLKDVLGWMPRNRGKSQP